MRVCNLTASLLYASVAVGAVIASAPVAMAGGFALREQSAEFQGMSFAGSAAGGALSSMYWNSAATASKSGMNFESSYSVIIPRAEVSVDSVSNPSAATQGLISSGLFPSKADGIAGTALIPATYGNYQLSQDLFIGLGINSGFGLSTEPNNANYKGAILAQTTRLTTFNFNPTIAYKIANGITVGVGAQIEYGRGTFRFATGIPSPVAGVAFPAGQTTSFEGDGFGYGATAGVMLEPLPGTTIGVGYRSQMDQHLDGKFYTNTTALNTGAEADLKLPDIVTVSIRQVIAPNARLLGTFEWTHWSRFQDLTVNATEGGATVLGAKAAGTTIASLPQNWHDSWFLSVGGEYDLSQTVTLRTGFAYEQSPIQNALERNIAIPDANRYWMSFGASWRALENVTFDLAYSHLFIEDGAFDRTSLSGTRETGSIKASTDIVSVGLKTKW